MVQSGAFMRSNSPILRRQRGFTLLELLTVMTILAMLATVGIVGYRSSVRRSREAVLKENLFLLNHALEQHKADRGKYPSSLNALSEFGYVRKIPDDPITGQADWAVEFDEGDPNQPDAESGIWRVRSASTELSSENKAYNEY